MALVEKCAMECRWSERVSPEIKVKGHKAEQSMPESVYKIIELVGTSTESWEKAASAAVDRASKSLRGLRIAEVIQLDMHVDGKTRLYRSKVRLSFKFEGK
jgi:flavin-binding protein dodecin